MSASGSNVPAADRIRQAEVQCQKALEHYQKGNRAAAIKALGSALDLDHSLSNDERIHRFAARLTGLPAAQAITSLTDGPAREALIVRAGKGKPGASKSTPLQSKPLWIFGTVMLSVTIFAVLALLLSGQLSLNSINPLAGGGEIETFQLAGAVDQEYLVAVPGGSPPVDGWPMLVVVHGAGQTGQHMVDLLAKATQNSGILLVAPTFPAFRDDAAFYEDGRSTLLQVTEDLKQKAFSQPSLYSHFLGPVYLGYAEGAPLVTYVAWKGLDYADAGFSIDSPRGVVLVNSRAPLFDAATYTPRPAYLLLYGELAPQAGISRDYNNRLTAQGAAVTLMPQADANEQLTAEQIDTIVMAISTAYQSSTPDIGT